MSPAPDLFDRIARHILTAHAVALPDLRGITVLLPNYHAAHPLAQALMRVAQRPALLLPQMVTLNEWAKSVPLAAPVATDSQRSAIFEPFKQVDGSLKRLYGGLGLGLALAKPIIELHGGTLAAHSQGADQGSVFTIELPTSAAATEQSSRPVKSLQT